MKHKREREGRQPGCWHVICSYKQERLNMNVLFAQINFCMGNFHLSVINQFSKKGSDNPTNIVVYNVYIWVTYGSMQTFFVKKINWASSREFGTSCIMQKN